MDLSCAVKAAVDEDDGNDNNVNVPIDGEPIISEQQQKYYFIYDRRALLLFIRAIFAWNCYRWLLMRCRPYTCCNSCL